MKPIILSLLAAASIVPSISPRKSSESSWAEIHAFISANATHYDSSTEASLWVESEMGEKSWTISNASRSAKLDGYGLGWPRNDEVIVFSNADDAQECGEMIDEYRESQGR